MNILVVSQYYYPEPFRVNEICEELVRRNNKVTVLTTNPNYPDGEIYDGYEDKKSIEEINGVTVYRCKCRPRHKGAFNLALNYVDFVRQANKEIMNINDTFDCIYVYQLSPITSCLPALKLKKKKNIPLFLYCLEVWPESLRGTALGNPIGMKIFGALSKYIYKSADKIAVTSPTFKKYISELCGIDISSIQFLPQHSSEIIVDHCNAESTNSEIVNFMFMGNIGEAQNIECLLRAIARIEDRTKFKFHIVGSGSHYKNCLELAEKLKIKDTVIFYGRHPKSEMPKFYALADVCYVSLRDEGVVGSTIPGKVQEYMSAEKPILACLNGDASDVIKTAECGICVPAGDEDELILGIKQMISSEVNLKLMGQNSGKYFKENYKLSVHVNELERALGEIKI